MGTCEEGEPFRVHQSKIVPQWADVRSVLHRHVPVGLRRPAGRLYLFVSRQGVCQCTDRQHRAVQREAGRGRLECGAALSGAAVLLCAGRVHGGTAAPEIPADAAAPLAAAGGAVRDRDAVRGRLLPAGVESGGQRAGLVCLRDAGAGLPQGERLRLCQHHVHRQPAQRHGFAVQLARGGQPRRPEQSLPLFCHHPPVRAGRGFGQRGAGVLRRKGDLVLLPAADRELLPDVPQGRHRGAGRGH